MGAMTPRRSRRRLGRRMLALGAAFAMVPALLPAAALADVPGTGLPTTDDPRVTLGGGLEDAETAEFGMELLGTGLKSENELATPFNSDLAFTRGHVIQGNYGGFKIWDVSDPTNPTMRSEVICPGQQGDPNVYGDLLFLSVQGGGAVDCAAPGDAPAFRGVRILDISDFDSPQVVAEVNTCRGSHTHRLVVPNDVDERGAVYVYNSGTSGVSNTGDLDCDAQGNSTAPIFNEDAARYGIEIIKIPLDDPGASEVIDVARLFRDFETGAINGLQNANPQPRHPSGGTYSPSPNTNTCHDITVFPEINLAAGACQGNGLLIDISDPEKPTRIDAVADVNFAYWHSANFSIDGSKVMFTDEWGGGGGARCRETDRLEWGANALFDIVEGDNGLELDFQSYYKMPAAQGNAENCVAHQANVLPVPGRDVIVQSWYQGGISVFDWTDTSAPYEIAYFDRGPINPNGLVLGGFWSAYYYNGKVFGSEIARGLDVLELTPTEFISDNELAVAASFEFDELNPMGQFLIDFEPSFTVVAALTDQAERAGAPDNMVRNVRRFAERAERFSTGPQSRAAVANLNAVSNQVQDAGFDDLAEALRDLAASL